MFIYVSHLTFYVINMSRLLCNQVTEAERREWLKIKWVLTVRANGMVFTISNMKWNDKTCCQMLPCKGINIIRLLHFLNDLFRKFVFCIRYIFTIIHIIEISFSYLITQICKKYSFGEWYHSQNGLNNP